jgi:hypothetical protein
MDRTQIDSEHVIARYLAGELDAGEDAAFEEFAAQHPEIYREVERTLRFKEGLAVLQDQGRLAPLLRARPSRVWAYLAVAVVVFASFGVLLWHRIQVAPPALLASSATEFARSGQTASPIARSFVLVRSRNPGGAVDLPLPARAGVVELRILPENPAGDRYSGTLTRLGPSGRREVIGTLTGLAAGADLYVTIYVDTDRLSQGDYEVSLLPEPAQRGGDDGDRFIVRVR